MTYRRLMMLSLTLATAGCTNDKELARMAEQTVAAQREQNRAMNQHNQKVIETTRELAEAAEQLVEKDAEARRELIVAHKELRTELHDERVGVDRQREVLEEERQILAQQRRTDPVIAAAIQAAALWLTCLAPLALASYVLVAAHRGDEHQAVIEMLVVDLAEHPRLIPQRLQQIKGGGSPTALPGPEPCNDDESANKPTTDP